MHILENIGIVLGVIASIVTIIFTIKHNNSYEVNTTYTNRPTINTFIKNTYSYNENYINKEHSSMDGSTQLIFGIIILIFSILFFVLFLNYIIISLIIINITMLLILIFCIKKTPEAFNSTTIVITLFGIIFLFVSIAMLKYPPLAPSNYEFIRQQIINEKITAIVRLSFESIENINFLFTQLLATMLICFSVVYSSFTLIKDSTISHKFFLLLCISSTLLSSGIISTLIEIVAP